MSASAIFSRSETSWRASQMSILSLKTMVTALTAVRLMERISSSSGRPFMAISTGNVRYDSTSAGDRPGELVMTVTCTLVTSGTASIDSLAQRGQRGGEQTIALTTSTTPRRRTAKATSAASGLNGGARSSSRNAPSVTTGSPSATPRTISTSSPPEAPSSTARCSKVRRRAAHEHEVLAVDGEHGAARHGQHRRRARAWDRRAGARSRTGRGGARRRLSISMRTRAVRVLSSTRGST